MRSTTETFLCSQDLTSLTNSPKFREQVKDFQKLVENTTFSDTNAARLAGFIKSKRNRSPYQADRRTGFRTSILLSLTKSYHSTLTRTSRNQTGSEPLRHGDTETLRIKRLRDSVSQWLEENSCTKNKNFTCKVLNRIVANNDDYFSYYSSCNSLYWHPDIYLSQELFNDLPIRILANDLSVT